MFECIEATEALLSKPVPGVDLIPQYWASCSLEWFSARTERLMSARSDALP